MKLSEEQLVTLPAEIQTAIRELTARNAQLEKENATLSNMMVQDPLTNAANLNGFNEKAKIVAEHHDVKSKVSFVRVDLDGFKKINDTEGHPAGDKALKDAVTYFNTNIRWSDFLARTGGDEFTLILPADAKDANAAMERVRRGFEKHFTREGEDKPYLSFSYGVSQLKDQGVAQALKECDAAETTQKAERKAGIFKPAPERSFVSLAPRRSDDFLQQSFNRMADGRSRAL